MKSVKETVSHGFKISLNRLSKTALKKWASDGRQSDYDRIISFMENNLPPDAEKRLTPKGESGDPDDSTPNVC